MMLCSAKSTTSMMSVRGAAIPQAATFTVALYETVIGSATNHTLPEAAKAYEPGCDLVVAECCPIAAVDCFDG